jgi:hypothetical protein
MAGGRHARRRVWSDAAESASGHARAADDGGGDGAPDIGADRHAGSHADPVGESLARG